MSATAAAPPTLPTPDALDRLLTVKTVGEILGIHARSVWRLLASDPSFPRPVKVGTGATRWRASDLSAYINALVPAR
jgi:predicted DNA-binding transcriptional regulator AlpA